MKNVSDSCFQSSENVAMCRLKGVDNFRKVHNHGTHISPRSRDTEYRLNETFGCLATMSPYTDYFGSGRFTAELREKHLSQPLPCRIRMRFSVFRGRADLTVFVRTPV